MKRKKNDPQSPQYKQELECASCHRTFIVLDEASHDKCICSCNKPFCTEKCERDHSAGYTIAELREMEKEGGLVITDVL